MASTNERAARALLDRFAQETGLDSGAEQRRYLWTDAFAVCTWLGLGEVERAVSLVDAVHRVLGRHRPDDAREGWISGLPEAEGERRPTAGGLRIGKPMPERGPGEPYEPQLEWDRDGQYFHYLTRWIRALQRVAEASGEGRYRRWAVELARVAYDRFSHGIGPVPNRLYWKMSIDLSRPLVPSMGQHDPLDGFVVMSELEGAGPDAPLAEALDGLVGMGEGMDWATEDPLGAGSLLTDAWALARLDPDPRRERILERVVVAAGSSVRQVRDTGLLELGARQRLAFRELGLAIGLAAAERLEASGRVPRAAAVERALEEIRDALPLREQVVGFWLRPEHRRVPTWTEHADINTVMLATGAAPDGYLGSASGSAAGSGPGSAS